MIAEDHLELACRLRYSCSHLYAGGETSSRRHRCITHRLIRSPQRVCWFSRCAPAGGLVWGVWRGNHCVLRVTTWPPCWLSSHLLSIPPAPSPSRPPGWFTLPKHNPSGRQDPAASPAAIRLTRSSRATLYSAVLQSGTNLKYLKITSSPLLYFSVKIKLKKLPFLLIQWLISQLQYLSK